MATTSNGRADEVDDLFDYDVNFEDVDFTIPDPEPLPPLPSATRRKGDDLGLDEEVQVKKKRVTVKLDEQRLLSIKGLPKLRKEAPKKLKFRGKGHEYRDAARLLSYYQLWADDLFKKAKFRDTLQIIEKLGHTRTLRSQREEWVEEARGAKRDRNDMKYSHEWTTTSEAGETRKGSTDGADDVGENGPNDDDLYSLPTGRAAPSAKQTNKQTSGNRDVEQVSDALFLGEMMDDSGEEMENFEFEDLDALIEVERQKAVSRNGVNVKAVEGSGLPGDDFEDDMEAMEAMTTAQDGGSMNIPALAGGDEFADEMEAMEAMETMEAMD